MWPSNQPTRTEQREQKRMAILRAAAKAFNQHGFRQTSLDDLATALEVSKPTLYYYVKNKDDILTGILDEAMAELRVVVAQVERGEASGIEKLRHFVDRYASVMSDDFGACLILTRVSALETKFRDQYRQASGEVLAAVQALVVAGIADGSIHAHDPKFVASALLGTMNETVYWYLVEGKESPQSVSAEFLTVFETGLTPRP